MYLSLAILNCRTFTESANECITICFSNSISTTPPQIGFKVTVCIVIKMKETDSKKRSLEAQYMYELQ
jgi:hypothetical protein